MAEITEVEAMDVVKISGISITEEEEEEVIISEDEMGGQDDKVIVKSTVYIIDDEINKYKGKVINVRSKEFNDLVTKFGDNNNQLENNNDQLLTPDSIAGFKTKDIVNVKFRRRPAKDYYDKSLSNANCDSSLLMAEKSDCENDENDKPNREVGGDGNVQENGTNRQVKQGKRPARLLLCKAKS